MVRLMVFLGVVLLLFQAGIREIAPPGAVPPSPRTVAIDYASRIAGPARPAAERGIPRPPAADADVTSAPFDLSLTTLADPASLAGDPEQRASGARFQVAAPKLSLRAGPSFLYPELATLSRGDLVVASGPGEGDWLWVRAQNAGLSGYVAAALVTRTE